MEPWNPPSEFPRRLLLRPPRLLAFGRSWHGILCALPRFGAPFSAPGSWYGHMGWQESRMDVAISCHINMFSDVFRTKILPLSSLKPRFFFFGQMVRSFQRRDSKIWENQFPDPMPVLHSCQLRSHKIHKYWCLIHQQNESFLCQESRRWGSPIYELDCIWRVWSSVEFKSWYQLFSCSMPWRCHPHLTRAFHFEG